MINAFLTHTSVSCNFCARNFIAYDIRKIVMKRKVCIFYIEKEIDE